MNGHEMAVNSNLAVPYQQPAASYVSDTSMYTESMLHSAAGAIVGKPPRSAPTTPRYNVIQSSASTLRFVMIYCFFLNRKLPEIKHHTQHH